MGQRFAYGVLAILVLLTLFLLDIRVAESIDREGALGALLERGSIVPLLFLALVTLGAIELRRLLCLKGAKPLVIFSHVMITLLILTPWLSAAGWLGDGPSEVEGLYWEIVWLIAGAVGTAVLIILRGHTEGAFRDVGATAILIFYPAFLASFGLQLRCGRDIPGQEGAWLLIITLLVIKASDIGGYVVGSLLGRHALAPTISPAKSIEGLVGGMIASVGVALFFASLSAPGLISESLHRGPIFLKQSVLAFSIQQHPGGISPTMRAVLFGMAMSVIGQAGDLLESCFKRDVNMKDSGRVIPAFGGILDLMDSPVLALPVAWFLLTQVWAVV